MNKKVEIFFGGKRSNQGSKARKNNYIGQHSPGPKNVLIKHKEKELNKNVYKNKKNENNFF